MTTLKSISTASHDDADLVAASLAGNRGAFGQIVARYQSLICALAYSATGNLSRSEDLAQDTFVTAWQRLPELREPSKLRAWLRGIARNLTSNAQRRAGYEPAHLAEPFSATHEPIAPEASPAEQTVSREEEAMLWRALEGIPETYREPLVLYYREHRSVANVAQELELSEDAVKQRLSRGRALLHAQVLALVEGTLERSNPGQAFMVGVMTALPGLGTGLFAAAGGATTKSAAGAKSATWLGVLGALLTAQVLWFVSSVAFVAGLGGFAGWQMSAPAQSLAERRWAAWFWRLFVGGLIAFVLPAPMLENWGRADPSHVGAFKLWLALFYVVAGVPLMMWAIENHRRIRARKRATDFATAVSAKSFHRWVAAGTLGVAAFLVTGLFGTHWYEKVRPAEVWEIVSAHPGAKIRINELEAGGRWIEIVVAEKEKTARYYGPLNGSTYFLLEKNGIRCETRVQGRDYDVLGWPGRRLPAVMIFAAFAGTVIIVRTWRQGKRASRAPILARPPAI